MSDWSSGYVTDIDYTYGYYAELNPLRVRLPFLACGLQPPEIATACELGYGQGLSVNLHAASSGTQWFGTDFNPAHAGFAQSMAAAAGADARLFELAFREFSERTDLPDFDFIGLHGIWSWISDENRTVIVDFLSRKLRPGGVLYVSYNTQPGWAALTPMRELLYEHNAAMGSPGLGAVVRFDAALAFFDKLMATQPGYARANPSVLERLAKIKTQDRNYLVHEYFDRDWTPMSVMRTKSWLSAAKMTYACSAAYLENIDVLNLTNEQQQLMREIPDPALREMVRDFCVNQQFRRDYWVKGARKVSSLEQVEGLRAERVLLTRPRAEIELKVKASLGEASLQELIHVPVLDAMASHKIMSLAQIEQAVKDKGVTFPQMVQAVMVNAGTGAITPAQDDAGIARARKSAGRLNTFICDKARSNGDIAHVASPVIGGGYQLGRFGMLFMLAGVRGKKTPAERAQFAWDTLLSQGQGLIKDGKPLATPAENLAELNVRAKAFVEQQLPMLDALGIAI